jgi:MoaA/NifB/PqqE/SkfB family radical SAM enzyme
MKWPLWHWHIENSSICSLRCPRCPRQEIPESLVQTSLDLDFFVRNFNQDLLKDVGQISFCGDDGDPIYGRDFLDIVTYLKRTKPNISLRIVTNGSYKKTDWWFNLARVLNQFDDIHFSLDGWDQVSNEQYRVNSNWASIQDAVRTVRNNSPVIMTWAAIAFKFNESQLFKQMMTTAKDWQFDYYQITKSTKFGSIYNHYYKDGNEPLEPSNPGLVSNIGRFERMTFEISKRKQLDNGKTDINVGLWHDIDKSKSIIPMCKIGNKGLYISADGYFYPCCWIANRYNHTRWQEFQQPRFDLKQRSIAEVLNDEYWNTFYNELHTNIECSTKCAAKNFDRDYATQW